ncbi:TadE family protein [Streptomyces sp. NPDC093109]|uniref:TadE/TadG family type IV pilus assembly protein n=1 Tax=Streptomyces sp. NPDC093109 TaxID=3154977 RepID=UPI00344CC53A
MGVQLKGRTATLLRDDRGQAAIEFTGMVPVILATVILLWQAALIGYTFSLAGNAADEAVRAGAVAPDGARTPACRAGAEKNVSGAWRVTGVNCWSDGSEVKANLSIRVPLLFPGVNMPFSVPAHASAVRES